MTTKKQRIAGGNGMKIINFEEAKARKRTEGNAAQYMPDADDSVLELERQYWELAQFYNRWYDEHVVGQDENGGWIYKNL